MSRKIVIVDYHKGNLLSVVRSLGEAGGDVVVSDDPAQIAVADAVVLPGVGAFADAMDYIRSSGEDEAMLAAVDRGVPFLGICLGLQLLFDRGDEGVEAPAGAPEEETWCAGLGILRGSATRLVSSRLKVPHVGWDQIHLTDHGRACPMLAGVTAGAHVYFTHSYAMDADVDDAVVATRTHYVRSFASTVWKDNVYGMQYHPEKSSREGLLMLENFVRIVEGGLA